MRDRSPLAELHGTADVVRVGTPLRGVSRWKPAHLDSHDRMLAFESRLLGPASATLAIDPRRAVSPERLAPGRRLEISFTDRAGKSHPLFCGSAAVVRPDPGGGRTDVVAGYTP